MLTCRSSTVNTERIAIGTSLKLTIIIFVGSTGCDTIGLWIDNVLINVFIHASIASIQIFTRTHAGRSRALFARLESARVAINLQVVSGTITDASLIEKEDSWNANIAIIDPLEIAD